MRKIESVLLRVSFWSLAICVPVVMVQGQTTPPLKSELSVEESKKIPPFPPKEALVEVSKGQAVITWTPIPSERITGYVIYRAIDSHAPEKIGVAKAPPFIDEHPSPGQSDYSVAALDYNNNQSKPRKAASKEKKESKTVLPSVNK